MDNDALRQKAHCNLDTRTRFEPLVAAVSADAGGYPVLPVPLARGGAVDTRVVCGPANRTWHVSPRALRRTPSSRAHPLLQMTMRNADRNAWRFEARSRRALPIRHPAYFGVASDA